MAFDCQVGLGRHSWKRSVIAMESDGDSSNSMPLHPDMMIDRSGRWQILYRPKQGFNFSMAGLTP